MTFRVGQKVVCVGALSPTFYGEKVPEVGKVYTIRNVRKFENGIGLHLREIANSVHRYQDGTYEAFFHKEFFRPVVEKSTDTGMAILREILDRESHDERVSA